MSLIARQPMLRGVVLDCRQAVVVLTFISSAGVEIEIPVCIDTGFTGELTLPSSAIRELGYAIERTTTGMLADGSTFECDVFRGLVVWRDKPVRVSVIEADVASLAGMKLLKGSRLTMDVVDAGLVETLALTER